jgi:RNA polymerase sigma-70 factor, ECF subfamily
MKLRKGMFGKQRRIREGDIEAFEHLFREYYAALCHYANSFVNNLDVAEEIVQEFFYNYWKNRQTIQIKVSVKSYLFTSIRNNALKHLEQLAVRQRYAERILATASEYDHSSVSEEFDARELKKIIDNALLDLPERSRIIFRMSRFDGLKYQEIADKLSISVKTVEANMSKVLQVLREKLKQYHAENTF